MQRTLEAIVWHDMQGYTAGAIARWNTGIAGAHLCVQRDGTVVLTCKIQDAAWHAGTDNNPRGETYGRTHFWRSNNVNPHSAGIELEGFFDAATAAAAGTFPGYTEAQMQACIRIARWAKAQGVLHQHTFDQIAGHHTHAEISSSRSDPGALFDLARVLRESDVAQP